MAVAPLLQVAVRVPTPAAEAVATLLERAAGQPAVLTTPANRPWTEVAVYLPGGPRALPETALQTLRQGFDGMRAAGVLVGRVRLTSRRIREEDWAESWKRHFRPIPVGGVLVIQPSWSRRRPRPGEAVVELDPGLSFGTGQHPTTAFCLEQLVAWRGLLMSGPVLDAGTGSGILAIAAAKLGCGRIEAFDHDRVAVRVARANAARNGVSALVRVVQRDVRGLPRSSAGRYALVCANLTTDLLCQACGGLVAALRPGGVLVLAGILAREFAQVRDRYESAGLRRVASRKVGGWQAGAFRLGDVGVPNEADCFSTSRR